MYTKKDGFGKVTLCICNNHQTQTTLYPEKDLAAQLKHCFIILFRKWYSISSPTLFKHSLSRHTRIQENR